MVLSKRKKAAIRSLAALDYFVAVLAWWLFLAFRQNALLQRGFLDTYKQVHAGDLLNGFIIVPGIWLFIYLLTGTYFDLYRKSRLNEVNRTLIACLIGSIIIALLFIGNDKNDYRYFIAMTGRYLILHTSLTLMARMLLFNRVKRNLLQGLVGYNTLLIGGGPQAVALYETIVKNPKVLGNIFKGFVYAANDAENGISNHLPNLGSLSDLENIIEAHQIEEVIVAVDSSEHHLLEHILTRLSYNPVVIKVLPDMYDIISGSVKTSNVYDAVLIPIFPELMPGWQRVFKRMIDILVSLAALVLLSPLYLFAAIRVLLSSPGPIIYKQQRIGLYGRPFHILKFRSMFMNAEQQGPALSSKEDKRITAWGKTMRKWRIDELPQFINILVGDMSLVGPRPERQHFIDIIAHTHPHYKYLHKVKPGLTSWGMVQYGYAENVSQMIDRLKYDLLYIENCSLALDIKILMYTFMVILQGRGK